MDAQVQQEIEQGGVIDITTTGRTTGEPRRIEIRFHHIAGQVYITGSTMVTPVAWARPGAS